MTDPDQPREETKGRPDASMTLLREIMERPRDGAYTDPRPSSNDERKWGQELIVLILTIAIGVGGVWAARQLRAPVDSAVQARAVLEEQIQERTAVTEGLRRDVRELRSEISELEQQISSEADPKDSFISEQTEIYAGSTEVSGPGIELELEEPSQPSAPEEYVLDVDLQIAANGLWASGAEAISLNGHRLTFGTAIRIAGEVILVDLEPVQSPYVLEAIGDRDKMIRKFADTAASQHLKILNSNYRIKSNITQFPIIEMPAGNSMRLAYAKPVVD